MIQLMKTIGEYYLSWEPSVSHLRAIVMPFIYRILSNKDGRIVVATLSKQFIVPVVVPL